MGEIKHRPITQVNHEDKIICNLIAPYVSIIIRTKNEARHIGETLEKVSIQSFQNFEVIVVDSGSVDGTIEIAKNYPKVAVHQILPEEFTFGYAINFGVEKSNGSILVLLSGHSVPVDNMWLSELISPLTVSEAVTGSFSRQLPHTHANLIEKIEYMNSFGDVGSSVTFSNSSSAFRKLAWTNNKFDESVGANEDYLWAIEEMKNGSKIEYVPTSLVYHSHDELLGDVYKRVYRETREMLVADPGVSILGIFLKQIAYTLRVVKVFVTYPKYASLKTGLWRDMKYACNATGGRFLAIIKLVTENV